MEKQSVAKGFAVLSAAGIIVKVLSLLYIPFLLAIIGEEGNGIYAAAYQVYVLVYVLSNSGIPVAISKLVSELLAVGNREDAARSFKIARFMLLIIGIVMSVLMFSFSYPLSRILHYEKSYLAILALSPTLLFTAVASAYRGYFQGRGNMVPTAVSQIIEQVINTVFTLVFAAILLRYGVEAACAGGTIGTSLGALTAAAVLVYFHRKDKKLPLRKKETNAGNIIRYSYSELAKKIIGYSVPITLSIGLQYAGNLIDVWNTKVRLLAAHFSDEQATQMYSYLYKYQQLLNAPIAVVAALAATILPAVSAAVALKNREQVENRINFAYRLCFMVTIPSAVGFSFLSDPIYKLLKYGQGSYLMLYGSIALMLLALVQIQTSILQGSGNFYPVTFNLVLGIIGKIAINYIFIGIPQININGAIIGSIVSYCIPITLNGMLMKRKLKVKIQLSKLVIKPLISSVLMGIGVFASYKIIFTLLFFIKKVYFINFIAVLISIIAGVCIYIIALIAIKGISNDDLAVVPQKILRRIPQRILNKIV